MEKAQPDVILEHIYIHEVTRTPGADPGFPVRWSALKIMAPIGARRENFWGISCDKSRF